jgi:dsRNA-specific ribonuclease
MEQDSDPDSHPGLKAIGGRTIQKRNRCNLDQLSDIARPDARSYDFPTVLKIVEGHWSMPPFIPTDLPAGYPPPPPLLDTSQKKKEIRNALRLAFTHNTVAYALPGRKSNLVLELFGDKVMPGVLQRILLEKIDEESENEVSHHLDQCGYDVSTSMHLVITNMLSPASLL